MAAPRIHNDALGHAELYGVFDFLEALILRQDNERNPRKVAAIRQNVRTLN